jgi:hypothetical protein
MFTFEGKGCSLSRSFTTRLPAYFRQDLRPTSYRGSMVRRTIKVTVYLTLRLFDKESRTLLKETYTECSFPVVVEHANADEEARNIVPDSLIHRELDQMLTKQAMLPELKKQYPDLPDFYIGGAKLSTQQAFFEDVIDN